MDIAGSEGVFAEMESPAVIDDGDEAWTTVIHENSDQNPAEKDFSPRQLSPDIIESDTIIIESNLGILRSVEFYAAKLLFD